MVIRNSERKTQANFPSEEVMYLLEHVISEHCNYVLSASAVLPHISNLKKSPLSKNFCLGSD